MNFLNLVDQENFATKLGQINNRSWSIFFIIVIIFLFVSQIVNISLSIIFFLVIALIICYIIYSKQQSEELSPNTDQLMKLDFIIPQPCHLKNYSDAVNFLYSTKDYYYGNPNAYYAMVSSMDNFFRLYTEIMNNKMIYCTDNLEVAVGFSRDALNNLQSMVYTIYPNKYLGKELQEYESLLYSIFQTYISSMAQKCNKPFLTGDINYYNKFYQISGPRAYNYYDYVKTGVYYTNANYDARNNFKIY